MKKVLWVNPSFLDYRIPLYDELNKLYQNNFHLIYSKQRVPQRCIRFIDRKKCIYWEKGWFCKFRNIFTFSEGAVSVN